VCVDDAVEVAVVDAVVLAVLESVDVCVEGSTAAHDPHRIGQRIEISTEYRIVPQKSTIPSASQSFGSSLFRHFWVVTVVVAEVVADVVGVEPIVVVTVLVAVLLTVEFTVEVTVDVTVVDTVVVAVDVCVVISQLSHMNGHMFFTTTPKGGIFSSHRVRILPFLSLLA